MAIAKTPVDAKDYGAIFRGVESTLIRVGSQPGRTEELHRTLEDAKTAANKKFTDADYFRTLVAVTFYSGYKAEEVTKKLPVIERYLGNYEEVANYGQTDIAKICADAGMIRNRRKIDACIDNARMFRSVVAQYGSFRNYIDSFGPKNSFETVARLREDLIRRFSYISKITSFHFLTDIGMPVLKPDRVIRRIFYRLGLICDEGESELRLLETVREGQKFVNATGHPIRYVDIVLVAYGQVNSAGFGISQGICVKNNPRCGVCGVRNFCQYLGQYNA